MLNTISQAEVGPGLTLRGRRKRTRPGKIMSIVVCSLGAIAA